VRIRHVLQLVYKQWHHHFAWLIDQRASIFNPSFQELCDFEFVCYGLQGGECLY
jgi:hypothetical protein